MKNFNYKILTSEYAPGLEENVDLHLQRGFKLHGPLQVIVVLGDTYP